MPHDRRIIFSTYVVPTQSVESEETSVRHTEFQTSPAGTLGGKGIATISTTQWGDGWTSFASPDAYWEDQGDLWELKGECWSGELEVTAALGQQLVADPSPCKFVYIKNTGTTNQVLVSNTAGINYMLSIPPNGSIHLRGDGTIFDCNMIYVAKSGSSTTIEYIIAQ